MSLHLAPAAGTPLGGRRGRREAGRPAGEGRAEQAQGAGVRHSELDPCLQGLPGAGAGAPGTCWHLDGAGGRPSQAQDPDGEG